MNLEKFKSQIADICQEFNVTRLSVFGSVARGTDGPNSDVDLLVKFGSPVGLPKLIRLEDRFSAIFGRRVDLGTEASLHPKIKPNVIKDLKIIYES